MKQAIEGGVAELGRLDIVVANAGICIIAPWDEVTPEIFAQTMDTNVTGVWHTVQLAAPHLIEAGGGSVILAGPARSAVLWGTLGRP